MGRHWREYRFGGDVHLLDPTDHAQEQDLIVRIRQIEARRAPAPQFGISAHCDRFCPVCHGIGSIDGAFCAACEGTGAEAFGRAE